ncbi:alpha/beta hydrolase [Sciscionella sediminilitoris]|uniref:alpha/beta hydrolase n=1 Tax=Sciscionella sediminilitoris TaxID=1445613 RepID=UPI0012E1E619|nr:alpha/beta hydrolase-fold protein [Sciscionella sp. SE31]
MWSRRVLARLVLAVAGAGLLVCFGVAGVGPDPDPRLRGSIGEVRTLEIPGVVSGFAARPARVYLPPAYDHSPAERFPVLEMLHGEPGDPGQWLASGGLEHVLNAFAERHGGVAPIVVMPDDTGPDDETGMLCMDSRLGKVESYLAVDVPDWLRAHFRVNPEMAVGGLSYGGSCALQLGVRDAMRFPTFLDLSGEAPQTLGTVTGAIRTGFGGNTRAFRAANPLDILARQRFPHSAGWFVAGAQDTEYGPEVRRAAAACGRAGMAVRYETPQGGHDWNVWNRGFSDALEWLTARLGIV